MWAVVLLLLAFLGMTLGLRWLWRIADAANVADWGGKWRNRIDGLNRLLLKHYHDFQPEQLALPQQGAALVVANHISGLDPMMMMAASRRPVRFMIAAEQYHRFGLRWLFRLAGCIPVDRKTRDDSAFQAALQALQRGEVVGLFPHGRIPERGEPPPRIRRGVARLASLSQAPVYPMTVSDIRAEGHVVLAVLVPSRARMQTYAPLHCDRDDEKSCLQKLQQILNKSET